MSAARPYPDALLHLAGLSIVAGAIHAVAAPPHFGEWWLHGAFFAALASFQLAWAVAVYRRASGALFRAGIAVSAAVIVLWLVSRTIGVPSGPEGWQVESVGPLDLAASMTEALIAVICTAFLRESARAPTGSAPPARYRRLHPIALAVMMEGMLALFLGGAHHLH